MSVTLADAEARLAEARGDVAALAALEQRHLERAPVRLLHDHDMRGARYLVRAHAGAPVDAEVHDRLAVALHALRESLDVLASALAGAPTTFPIHDSLPAFAQRARRALSPMPDAAQAGIEALQPYHAIGGYRNGPLWLLRELAAAPRLVLAAGGMLPDAVMGVNTRRKVELLAEPVVTAGAFDDGGIVASVATRIVGPDPKLDMFLRARFAFAFARDGPARGALVGETLDALVAHLAGPVFRTLAPSAVLPLPATRAAPPSPLRGE